MGIPRGTCDCCDTETSRLCEVKDGLRVCDDCAMGRHACPDLLESEE